MSAHPSLGLYFSDSFIEVSQISANGSFLERFNQITLPTGLIVNGEIKNKQGFLYILQSLLSTAKPKPIKKNQDVVIGVSDNLVFLKEFTVPKFTGDDIDEAVEYQIRTLLPVLPSGVETDWEIIGRDVTDQIEVLLTALSSKIINSYIEICTLAGLRVVAIEPAVFANTRIIEPDQFKGKNTLLVFIGDNYATFSYLTNGNPRFSDFLSDIEIHKNGDITQTISSYVNFANSKHENRKITGIVISGYHSRYPQLMESLMSDKFSAVLAKSRLTTVSFVDKGLLHTSQGLSLKTYIGETSPNLLPVDFRQKEIGHKYIVIWKVLLTLMIVATALILGVLFSLFLKTRSTVANLNSIKNQYTSELSEPKNMELIKGADDVVKMTNNLLLLRDITGGEENLLKEISSITFDGIKITGISFNRGTESKKLNDSASDWIITGVANTRPLVLIFYNKLINLADFSSGKLYFGSLEKELRVVFRISSNNEI